LAPLLSQATSVLLHLAVFLLPKHGFKGTPLHTACGLALIGSFALFRLVPIPYLLYSLWANRVAFAALSPALKFTSCVALPIPMLLNLYWCVWRKLLQNQRFKTSPAMTSLQSSHQVVLQPSNFSFFLL
jgi:hypothetical protein